VEDKIASKTVLKRKGKKERKRLKRKKKIISQSGLEQFANKRTPAAG
jgi:hypothetical protein